MALALVTAQSAQEKPVEALDGTDPVLLVQGKDTLGKPEFRAVHEGFEYLFASAETKAEFEKNPAKYAVQFGGLCARMGKTASGNMSDYLVHDGKIYVFGSDDCHKMFAAAPAKYLAPKPDPDAGETRRARARTRRSSIGRRSRSAGERLDSMTSLVESSSQTLRRMDADVPVRIKTTWRFPDAVRVERQMTRGDRTMSNAMLLTRAGAWYQSQGQSYPMSRAARSYVAVEHERQLVALLRARRDEAFVAAALGRASTEDGMDLERVRIRHGDLDVTLGLDPLSARPRSLSFIDRNDVGEFGRFVLVYDGLPPVDGLTLPFAVRGSFNGQPDAAQTWTVVSVQGQRPDRRGALRSQARTSRTPCTRSPMLLAVGADAPSVATPGRSGVDRHATSSSRRRHWRPPGRRAARGGCGSGRSATASRRSSPTDRRSTPSIGMEPATWRSRSTRRPARRHGKRAARRHFSKPAASDSDQRRARHRSSTDRDC